MDPVQFADGSNLITAHRVCFHGKSADQAGWKKAHSGQYLCYSHATTSFLLMTKILCVAGRRVPLGD